MSRNDHYASAFGAVYSAYMERPRLGRIVGRAVWGGDTRRYYESMEAVAAVPDGGTIVDCPCGAGPAFRALRPRSSVHYVAADLSPAMLRRARERAAARGLHGIEFIEAEASDLPLPSQSVDLFLSFWGLHCFANPAGALEEAARVLKRRGRLVGTALLRGTDTVRQRLLIRSGAPGFGRTATEEEVREWLEAAGLPATRLDRSGPMLFFEARRSDRAEAL